MGWANPTQGHLELDLTRVLKAHGLNFGIFPDYKEVTPYSYLFLCILEGPTLPERFQHKGPYESGPCLILTLGPLSEHGP